MYLKAVAGREKCVTDLLHFSTYMSEKSNKTLDGRTEREAISAGQNRALIGKWPTSIA